MRKRGAASALPASNASTVAVSFSRTLCLSVVETDGFTRIDVGHLHPHS